MKIGKIATVTSLVAVFVWGAHERLTAESEKRDVDPNKIVEVIVAEYEKKAGLVPIEKLELSQSESVMRFWRVTGKWSTCYELRIIEEDRAKIRRIVLFPGFEKNISKYKEFRLPSFTKSVPWSDLDRWLDSATKFPGVESFYSVSLKTSNTTRSNVFFDPLRNRENKTVKMLERFFDAIEPLMVK